MSLGTLALGVASVVLGVHHVKKGLEHLSGSDAQGLARPPLPRKRRRRIHAPPAARSGFVHTPVGPSQMRIYNIRGLDDRIKVLRERVDAGSTDPRVYTFARQAINGKCGGKWCVPEKDNLSEAKAIFQAVRKRVRYTSDILRKDTYQHPAKTLALAGGDCDDMSTLICASLESVGIPCRFKVIRTRGASDWNHIYPQAGFPRARPTKWISMDASVNMPFGWEAPQSMVADTRIFSLR